MPGIAVVKPVVRVLHGDVSGTPKPVQASDIAALPVRLGAAIRARRLFHPNGVLAEGLLERVAPPDDGLPMQSCDVIGGSQKGSAYPAPHQTLPAWHFESRLPRICDRACPGTYCWRRQSPVAASSSRPAGPGLARHSPASCRFDSKGGVWWVRARLVTKIDEPGLSLDTHQEPNRFKWSRFRHRAGRRAAAVSRRWRG